MALMVDQPIREIPLPREFPLVSRGKVRDTFGIPPEMVGGRDDLLLQVTTDRASALNVKLMPGIADRGLVLVGLTTFFAQAIMGIREILIEGIKTHIVEADFERFSEPLRRVELLRGRSLIIRRQLVVPIESVVRFYLTGTAWRDYQRTGAIFGCHVPAGLKEWDPVPESACWTPTLKSALDEPLTLEILPLIFNGNMIDRIRYLSIQVMNKIAELADKAGFVLIDGKLEWGINRANELVLVDEWGTPDACRWVTKETFEAGQPVSYDKDPIRHWLQPILDAGQPVPEIPAELQAEVRERYLEVYRRVAGQELV